MPLISGASFPHSLTWGSPPDTRDPTQIEFFGCGEISAIA